MDRYWLHERGSAYEVRDRNRQPLDEVARVADPEDGRRLVRLLNEDEARREAAMQALANQAQEMNLGY